jgi:hypothetical protein
MEIQMLSRNIFTLPNLVTITCIAIFGLAGLSANAAEPAPTPAPAPTETAAVPTVTCDKSPGAGLCYALSDALVDFGYNKVSGNNAVDAMLNGESSSGASVVVQFEMAVLPTDIVSDEIAKMANELASYICGQKVSGPPASGSYGYQADVQDNKVLPRLVALQKQGGIKTPKTCKISL